MPNRDFAEYTIYEAWDDDDGGRQIFEQEERAEPADKDQEILDITGEAARLPLP